MLNPKILMTSLKRKSWYFNFLAHISIKVYQVLELNGVLDAESVRQAARNGQITVRNADGSDPLVQVCL